MANITLINKIVTIIYVSIQVVIALFVSIVGAIHVHRSLHSHSKKELSNTDNQRNENEANVAIAGDTTSDKTNVAINIEKERSDIKRKSFCELWLRTVWKMRSVYASLTVHSFDVLTDVLVIFQWMNTENIEGDNIDPQIMAYSGITVIVFSRIVSSIAIYIKDQDVKRSMLQLFDLLIFQEIYEAHHKIVSQFKNKQIQNKKEPIESTLSFKYVRNMEAIFESIPESVLQLVYVMRVGASSFNASDQPMTIFIISIIQSTISMTNSILNNDYTMMKEDKWARYKQRFPPTMQAFQHAICRVSEIIYRIGLLALFWSVCEGLAFSILLGFELLLICARTAGLLQSEEIIFDADSILLALSSIIVIPSEEMHGIGTVEWHVYFGSGVFENWQENGALFGLVDCCIVLCGNICCCLGASSCLTSIPVCCKKDAAKISLPPAARIGTSLCEMIFMLIWSFFGENGSRRTFLFDEEHGLIIFIATSVCFLIFSQYRVLFPDFSLPLNVNVRSKWGYAYANELSELKKIKVPLKRMPYEKRRKSREKEEQIMVVFDIVDEAAFWDEPYTLYDTDKPITAAMFASAKGNNEIVQWLEDRGANAHKTVDLNRISKLIHAPQ